MNINELHSFKMSDAVQMHDTLNPALFNDDHLKTDVRKKLLEIAEEFIDDLGINNLDVSDIVISGSNSAYSYTPHSDIDLHIITDMKKLPDDSIYQELFTAKKNLFNSNHSIKIKNYDVEVYVQDSNKPVRTLGEYSILNDKWNKLPSKRRANFDQAAVEHKFDKLVHLSELALRSDDMTTLGDLLGTIKRYRQAGLDEHGEFGPENLAYKALRTHKIVDKLYDHMNDLKSRQLSLDEMIAEQRESLVWLKGKLSGSYTDKQLKELGAKLYNGQWAIPKTRYDTLVRLGQLRESDVDEDYDPNGRPPGPEFPPTMPRGTVKVDVSDVYDWYKLGQHISNLKGLGKHDFGKGPPSTIISFGDEDTEHEYIKDLEKTGLSTTDIDPSDPKQPKNMKRQKVDPTYNVAEASPFPKSNDYIADELDKLQQYCEQNNKLNTAEYVKAYSMSFRESMKLGVQMFFWMRNEDYRMYKFINKNLKIVGDKIDLTRFIKRELARKNSRITEEKLMESALFLNPTTVIVGQEHGRPLELSTDTLKKIQDIAAKHGAWYEGNGTDRGYTKGQIDKYVGSWDDEVAEDANSNDPKWLYVLFANVDENNRVQRVGIDPKDTIFNRLLATAKDNSFQNIGYTSQALKKFLQMVSEGKYDFVKMSQQPATQENLTRFLKAGEALMWPSNWEQYPNRAGKIAKAATVDVRDQYLSTRKAGVYVTGSGHLKAVQNITGRQDVAEASGYIPSEAEKNDPRFKTALTVDIHPNTMKQNAKKLGSKISRAGIPPILKPSGKI